MGISFYCKIMIVIVALLNSCNTPPQESEISVVQNYVTGEVKVTKELFADLGFVEREYDFGGNLIRYSEFKPTGFKDGVEILYYPSGNRQSKTIYKDGLKEDVSRAWYESGELFIEASYKKGITVYLKKYFKNGHIMADVPLVNGNIEGYATYYDENGKVVQTGSFSNNMKTGEWKYYDFYDSLHTTEVYRNDTLIEVNYY